MDSKDVSGYKVAIKFDVSEINMQLNELVGLVHSRLLESIHDQLLGQLSSLSFDIVFGDSSSTLLADGTIELLQRLRFGSRFEDAMAAFRTAKIEVGHD
jgi:hypothetical protein